jgi:hypothetical protein
MRPYQVNSPVSQKPGVAPLIFPAFPASHRSHPHHPGHRQVWKNTIPPGPSIKCSRLSTFCWTDHSASKENHPFPEPRTCTRHICLNSPQQEALLLDQHCFSHEIPRWRKHGLVHCDHLQHTRNTGRTGRTAVRRFRRILPLPGYHHR